MKVSINEFLAGKDISKSYGFYDWFCREDSLEAKAKAFIPKLRFLVKEELIDGDKNYVNFKNNCPVDGSLYDDMRISNIKTDKFLGGFCPKTGHTRVPNKADLWFFTEDIAIFREFANWSELKKALKTDESLRAEVRKAFL